MRVNARVLSNMRDLPSCISIRTPQSEKFQMVGTVLLTDVSVAANIRGTVLESSERRITPKQEILAWPKMRYVAAVGGYVDTRNGQPVTSAKAVYMVGPTIYYLPNEEAAA